MTTSTTATPKSYLPEEEREALMREESMNLVYLAESDAADKAGDGTASWAWLARAELPAHSLLFIKARYGSSFIRDMGFPTTKADTAYGPGWLDRA